MTNTQIGEAYAGTAANAVHVNTVLGPRGGPLEAAFAGALASPRPGHIPFLVVLRPNLPVKPLTLFVNKAEVRGERHQTMTWGAGQAGVARGVAHAVSDGVIASEKVDELLAIAAVWIDWAADDEHAVYENAFQATRDALEAGTRGFPPLAQILEIRDEPINPFFAPGG
jgi:5,6,7,8-tetrahydromethanopterin hydro-lyase